jgi:hypothetical protein
MIMTLEEHRAKNTLALRNWRHRNREHYRTYQREYKRRYISRMKQEYAERMGQSGIATSTVQGVDHEQVA